MSGTLDIHPAFGFESKGRWDVAVEQRDEHIRQAGRDPAQACHRLWGDERRSVNNISKIVGYFPLLNIVIGIARIIINAQLRSQNPEKKAIIARHIWRGIAEICFGPILIIPDVVQTILDNNVVQKYKKAHPMPA
jgi:hypothetical protein